MTIWVGRYAIVDGVVREHGPWFVERTRTQEDETVRLLVLAEPVDARSAEFCAEVADAIAELFTRESLSVTGGLLRALRQAHQNLAEWNRRSLREHHVAVGITAVAIRNGEVVVAQAGPGVVYISSAGDVQRLEATERDAARPLGGDDSVEPQFYQTYIEDRLVLLLTSGVERAIGQQPIANALAAGPERALAELFMRTRDIRNMNAVLVADLDVPEELLAPAEPERNPAPVEAASAPAEVAAAAPQRRPWREPWNTGVTAPPPVDSGAEFIAPRRRFGLPSLRRDRGYAPRGTPPGVLARVGVRSTAPPSDFDSIRRQWRAAAIAGIALLAVVLLAVCALPGFVRQDRGAQLEDALAAASAHIQAAQQAPDVQHSRTELDAARNEVARARGINGSDSRVGALQTQVDTAARALDAVTDLGDGLKRIVAFDGTITAPFNMAAMVFGDNALWTLDSQRGRIFRIDPTGKSEPQEVYRTGATYGTVTARDPVAMAWDTNKQQLLLLDSTRALFAIQAGKPPVTLTVRGAKDIKSIAALASYSGNLYVLDPQGGEIWRYLPAGDGFDSERTGLLGNVDLGDARGVAVDGEFYVLGSATVRHFRPPTELQPLLQGIDRPVASATGIAVDAQHQLVYVGDRGGRRLAVSDRGGTYRRQYRAPAFFDVRGLTLSADATTVYVLTGEGLFAFTPTR